MQLLRWRASAAAARPARTCRQPLLSDMTAAAARHRGFQDQQALPVPMQNAHVIIWALLLVPSFQAAWEEFLRSSRCFD